jgi:hypothetical protein
MQKQTNRQGETDIIAGMTKPPAPAAEDLPEDSAWLFPEYRFEDIRLDSYRAVIIERILERGSWEQVRWLFATYGETEVAEWVRRHGFRLLSKRSFALWRLTLDVEDYFAPDWAREAKEGEPW